MAVADIIGKEHPLSGRIWLESATPLGAQIMREAALELYGDATIGRILYETRACEGAHIVGRMAERGVHVRLPHYALHSVQGGREALGTLG